MRQLKPLLRYAKCTEDVATVFEVQCNSVERERERRWSRSWRYSQTPTGLASRKSTSGAVIVAKGMKLHAYSRDQAAVALSSCEPQVVAASQGIKEALLLQEVLMFAGLGHCVIEVKVDSSVRKLRTTIPLRHTPVPPSSVPSQCIC